MSDTKKKLVQILLADAVMFSAKANSFEVYVVGPDTDMKLLTTISPKNLPIVAGAMVGLFSSNDYREMPLTGKTIWTKNFHRKPTKRIDLAYVMDHVGFVAGLISFYWMIQELED